MRLVGVASNSIHEFMCCFNHRASSTPLPIRDNAPPTAKEWSKAGRLLETEPRP